MIKLFALLIVLNLMAPLQRALEDAYGSSPEVRQSTDSHQHHYKTIIIHLAKAVWIKLVEEFIYFSIVFGVQIILALVPLLMDSLHYFVLLAHSRFTLLIKPKIPHANHQPNNDAKSDNENTKNEKPTRIFDDDICAICHDSPQVDKSFIASTV